MGAIEEAKEHDGARQKIEVTVTFPLAQGQPYHDKVDRTATVATVQAAALGHFQIVADPNSKYFLTHDGTPEPDATTIEAVAGPAGAVKLTLVKELIQG